MKSTILAYLKHLLVTLSIVAVVSLLVLVFGNNKIKYGRNNLVTNTNLNKEGPYVIYQNDSTLQINYILGEEKTGFSLEQRLDSTKTATKLNCNYYLDSSSFSFLLQKELSGIEDNTYPTVDSIFVVSDIESNYNTLKKLLIANNIVNETLNWTFGKGHLVLLGDFVDRGYFTKQVLWLIYKLEQEASQQNGKVHFILGNHEIMNMQGNHNYAKLKYAFAASALGIKQYQLYDSTTYTGRWLATKNVVEKIGSYLFTHGGLHPDFANNNLNLQTINDIARKNYYTTYVQKQDMTPTVKLLLSSKTSPYWYSGYFKKSCSQQEIDNLLEKYEATQIVVGHATQNKVRAMFNKKIVTVDVDHPQDHYQYWPKKKSQALLIANEIFYRVNDEGKRRAIIN